MAAAQPAVAGRKPSRAADMVFWIGTPVLAVLFTILLTLGVLRLRPLVQADRAAASADSRFEYVPWTPEPMPMPDAVEIIELDPVVEAR